MRGVGTQKFGSHADFTELAEAHGLRVLTMRDVCAMICAGGCRGRTLCRPVVNLRTITPICVRVIFNFHTDCTEPTEAHVLRVLTLRDVCATKCAGGCRGCTLCRSVVNLRTITPIRVGPLYNLRTIAPICVGTSYNLRTIASIRIGTLYNVRTIASIHIDVKYKFIRTKSNSFLCEIQISPREIELHARQSSVVNYIAEVVMSGWGPDCCSTVCSLLRDCFCASADFRISTVRPLRAKGFRQG